MFVCFVGFVLLCLAPWICATVALCSLFATVVLKFVVIVVSEILKSAAFSIVWRAYTTICRILQPSTLLVFEAIQEILDFCCTSFENYVLCGCGLTMDSISYIVMLPLKFLGGSCESILGPAVSAAAFNIGTTSCYLLAGSACAAAGLKLGWTATSAAGSVAVMFHRNVLRVLQQNEPLSGPIGQVCIPSSPSAESAPSHSAPWCVVCHDAPVGAALRPCFHAGYCVRCADDVFARRMPCPMCRCATAGVQRIFLP